MTRTFTQNDVLRFVYNEVNLQEKEEIHNAILMDSGLLEFYYEMSEIRNEMKALKREPSDRAMENILNYSRAFSYHSA
ncbi:MAG: hypothetical protein ACK4ND_17145 [Cytophagaceae bacterium]